MEPSGQALTADQGLDSLAGRCCEWSASPARLPAPGSARREPAWTEPTDPYVQGAQRLVTLAGRPVRLTAAEYDLLYELSADSRLVVTHDELLRRIWGPRHSGDARLIRALVRRLRRKLGDNAARPT